MKHIITGLLLTLMWTVGWGEDAPPSSCKVVFSCDSDSRYRFNRTSGSIGKLPQETFIFWIRDTKVETDYQTGKFMFDDSTLPLELQIGSCESIQRDVDKLAQGIKPVFYGFTAINRYASIKFRDKKLSGVYLEGNDGIEVFNATCSVVGTPQA
jgi:hypothetical protein